MAEAEHEPSGTEDEAKRRFREALDRKNGGGKAQSGGPDGSSSSGIHEEHGPAGGRRTFRRKSGG